MSANLYKPHLLVLPEDDKNASAVVAFRTRLKDPRLLQVEPVCGGWKKVLECFKSEHEALMRRYPQRHVLLVMDFDDQVVRRLEHVRDQISMDVSARVYVMGSLGEPEDFKTGEWAKIGERLAQDCERETNDYWNSPHLVHNEPELARLTRNLRPLLFAQ